MAMYIGVYDVVFISMSYWGWIDMASANKLLLIVAGIGSAEQVPGVSSEEAHVSS